MNNYTCLVPILECILYNLYFLNGIIGQFLLILSWIMCVGGEYLHVSTGARGVFSEVLVSHELELEAGVSYSNTGAEN